MKISLALLILLLAAASTGSQGRSFHSSRTKCCPKFYPRKIPEGDIQGYRCTPSTCTFKAVLVKLEAGWVCVNPQKTWLQRYLKNQKNLNCTSM